mgnify:CR=1 FL=1
MKSMKISSSQTRLSSALLSKTLLVAALSASVATPLLSGCIVAGAAAVTTGTMAAADRRTLGTQVEDRSIQLKATSGVREKVGSAVNINATVYNRQVLLTGQAPDAETRRAAELVVANITNVRAIVNEVELADGATLSVKSNDALITTKVKASLVDARDVYANSVKVTTENSVVYLMGILTEREANRAADIAAYVNGVSKVVKVIDIISEDELAKMKITPSNGVENQVGTPSQIK